MGENKPDIAWENILRKYDIPAQVKENGLFEIKASQIKEFREPRLMAKWDSSEVLPAPLKREKLNILPLSRKTYAISSFQLYQPFPDSLDSELTYVPTKSYETIDFDHLDSESNAINAMCITGILDNFLGTEIGETVETFNGRMAAGSFSFEVDLIDGGKERVRVDRPQLEIDGGFENDDSVIIMEAKNVPHPDFHVRQLYFPYRLWFDKVRKPIRLIFSQYVDSIYHLFEYEFEDPYNYSSIKLLKQRNYTFQSSAITWDDLKDIWNATPPVTDDNRDEADVPFPQADRMANVITLMQRLNQVHSMNAMEIADYMEFAPRQSNYYSSAGEYLGLFEHTADGRITLSAMGKQIMRQPVRERRLAIVKSMFQHEIFHALFGRMCETGFIPSKNEVCEYMKRLNVCERKSTMDRRASTVIGWLKWIASFIDED